MKSFLLFSLLVFGGFSQLSAQQREIDLTREGIGLRFASTLGHYFRSADYPLIEGRFATGVIGLTYKWYQRGGHMETGLCFGFKETDKGFALPYVMKDYGDSLQATRLTYYQFEYKVGPRVYWYFHPKFGFNISYRPKQEGFVDKRKQYSDIAVLNKFLVTLPIGFSIELPTSFGTTGVAFFYQVGISNAIKGWGWNDGSRLQGLTFEIHVLVRTD